MRRFLAFGVSAAVSVAFFPAASPLALAESVKPRQGVEKPKPGDASRGNSAVAPGSADTHDDAEARSLREADQRKATESKEKMKKRPGYKEDAPPPRASGGMPSVN